MGEILKTGEREIREREGKESDCKSRGYLAVGVGSSELDVTGAHEKSRVYLVIDF